MNNPTPNTGAASPPLPPHPHRTIACLLGLLLAACSPLTPSAQGQVYDHFDDPAQSELLWQREVIFGPGGAIFTGGQATLDITPEAAHGLSSLLSIRRFRVQSGRVLRLSADLIRSTGDGAMARLGFTLADGSGGYILWIDQDSIAISKRPSPLQLFHLANDLPTDVTNVKLVMTLTGLDSSIHLRCQVLDNHRNGAVLFDYECVDTPEADPMAQGTDNPPASLLDLPGSLRLGLYHDNTSMIDPTVEIPPQSKAEVTFDNADVYEYEAPHIAINPGVLLDWPENPVQSQIPLAAPTVSGPWTPLPEPILVRQSRLGAAAPLTSPRQFFQLASGSQFQDRFCEAELPFTTRAPWTPWFAASAEAAQFSLTVSNGVFHLAAPGQPANGMVMLFRPGTGPAYRDFQASIDILDWASSQESALGIAGRVQGDPNGIATMYLGSLRITPSTSRAQLYFFNGGNDVAVPGPFTVQRNVRYRLEFAALHHQLTVRCLALTQPSTVMAEGQLTDTQLTHGPVALWINTRGSSGYQRTLDNFFVTGTHP